MTSVGTQLLPHDVLCAVDCDYLYGAARELYGDASRISFLRLQELMKHGRSPEYTYQYHAFLAVKKVASNHGQLQFVSRLGQWGYAVHAGSLSYHPVTKEKERDNITGMMIEFIKDTWMSGTFAQTLIVASGSVLFYDLYAFLAHYGIAIEVMSFTPLHFPAFHLDAPPFSKHVLLTEDVLYTPVVHP
jgi:hypothetical protein